MKVQASAKHIRISPRKIRLVVDQVRGLSVAEAERVLQFMNKKGAESVLKLIRSAAANAEHNNKLQKENLYIASITADEGFTIKRYRARAFGRAAMIRKRTSQLTVVLDEKEGTETKKAAAKKAPVAKKKTVTKKAAKPATK
ncbi:MAG: 50S ribosomal protein L22 [Candidatus Kerfeldbacteria bacterium]